MAGEQLRVTEGKERGKLLSVDVDLLIGRQAPEDEGRLGGDSEISRRHARVSRGAGGQLAIEDLGSANGTYVNEERIATPRTLHAGDVIRVGKTALEVTRTASEPLPAEPLSAEREAAPADAGAILLVTAGSAAGRRLELADELVIGRRADGQGRLSDDLELSRRHARVVRAAGGRLTIEDLGSANGTFVNGERVEKPRALRLGDSIKIGSTTLELVAAEAAPESPAAAVVMPEPPPPAEVPEPPPPAGVPEPPPRAEVPEPPAPAEVPEPLPPAPARVSEVPLGSVFAGCRVEELISHGDMGVVYRAEELALQRPVALKLILPEYSRDERFRERFRRESKIAAAIDHPNVIPVFDAGDQGGVLYIMMRLVEGTDLRALIATKGGHIDPLRVARIVRQVGAALDAAHARGMLHRDIKPSNVLIARRDHVYLSDFGLAKQATAADALTRGQTIVARAEYVAPEQILNEPVDARADIYALGCLLYEALTGEAPFATWTGGPGALAHLDAPRPTPSDVRPEVPRGFDDVVHRAMATDPSERYMSAGDLGQAALVAAGELRRARPESTVATGEAALLVGRRSAGAPTGASPAAAPARARDGGRDALPWAIAIAGLVLVAVGMVAALHGISTL
jgi:pSer/pThr/pTyr-binding forkhead associated (FHA) protein